MRRNGGTCLAGSSSQEIVGVVVVKEFSVFMNSPSYSVISDN